MSHEPESGVATLEPVTTDDPDKVNLGFTRGPFSSTQISIAPIRILTF